MIENKAIMARNIKKNMDRMGVNATEICKTLNIKQNTFSDWINAKTYPRIDKIELMARYFGITKADLVEQDISTDHIILSNDEQIVVETMRSDKDFKNHLVKYARMLTIHGNKDTKIVRKVAEMSRKDN